MFSRPERVKGRCALFPDRGSYKKIFFCQLQRKEGGDMNKKLLFVIIGVLAVALILETGYIIGKALTEKKYGKTVPERDHMSRQSPSRTGISSRKRRTGAGSYPGQWDAFEEMRRMQKVMNRMFNDTFGRGAMTDEGALSGAFASYDPAIDVREDGGAYIVTVDLPGVDKDTIDINAYPRSISISGERMIERQEADDSSGFYRAERSFGSFQRTIPFNKRIIPEKVTAETSEGVLVIRLPKEDKKDGEEEQGEVVKVR
jgi:HSP20 family protein